MAGIYASQTCHACGSSFWTPRLNPAEQCKQCTRREQAAEERRVSQRQSRISSEIWQLARARRALRLSNNRLTRSLRLEMVDRELENIATRREVANATTTLDPWLLLLEFMNAEALGRPLRQIDIAQIPEMVYQGQSRQTECPICLDSYVAGERLRIVSGCAHVYHSACLEQWLRQGRAVCPLDNLEIQI
eukprot:TRINITY_DN96789_c0_g1_i1.p1 TRINITY_DN96789_c0_g1~~TRINITY_DN96789_c0_g1_i1.p1  ORF type:complete len:213 (-),score=13.38 TRINITY_DN96789_c0_g1_i1:64-633(-)